MPTYAYACTSCDHRFDVQQAFTDDALTECPQCHGRLRKVFGAVGVVFKGSGFYRTDSRGKTSASAPSGSGSSSSGGDPASAGSSGSGSSSGSSSGGSSASTSSGTSGGSSGGSASGGSTSSSGSAAAS